MEVKVVGLDELRPIKDMASLKGKKAIVTGAAGGIGRSSAAALAEMGADVAIVDLPQKLDISTKHAEYIADKFGVKAIALGCDLTKPEDVQRMVDETVKQLGSLDIVHSNAGGSVPTDNGDIPYEDWLKTMDMCLNSCFLVNQKSAQWMRANKVAGSIINTASISGHIINRQKEGDRTIIAYCVAKAAVIHLTKGMAIDFREDHIRFNSISPGYAFSGLHSPEYLTEAQVGHWAYTVPMNRIASMNELGGIVAFLASDNAHYMTGADILIDGGLTAWG